MIEKLDKKMEFVEISILGNKKAECLDFEAGRKLNLKINELIDAVNELQLVKDVMFNRIDMLNNAICDIRNRITTLDDPTCHKKAQDMYDNAILDALKDKQVDVVVEPADLYAEQRKWVGCLCWFWNFDDDKGDFSILTEVDNKYRTIPFITYEGHSYANCEPVKPDDDIIYKGE